MAVTGLSEIDFLVEASLQSSSDGQRMRIVVHDTG
jgi:hypothetical protein